MTDKEDDKTVISLAAKRQEQSRDFAGDRAEIVAEVLRLGLPESVATASAEEVMFCDWLVYRACESLGRMEHAREQAAFVSAKAVVKLVGIMRRGIEGRLT